MISIISDELVDGQSEQQIVESLVEMFEQFGGFGIHLVGNSSYLRNLAKRVSDLNDRFN